MRNEIGTGMVGIGRMGQVDTRAYRRLLDHYPTSTLKPRLVIAADAVEERARDSIERIGYGSWTTDWREVVEHPEVEAVSITAPNGDFGQLPAGSRDLHELRRLQSFRGLKVLLVHSRGSAARTGHPRDSLGDAGRGGDGPFVQDGALGGGRGNGDR